MLFIKKAMEIKKDNNIDDRCINVEVRINTLMVGAMVSAFFITTIICGSFYYTREVKEDLTYKQRAHEQKYGKKFERVTREIQLLTTATQLTVVSNDNLVGKMNDYVEKTDNLIELILSSKIKDG